MLTSGDVTDGVVNVAVPIAGGPTQLQFLNNGTPGGNSDVGALLDNVSISPSVVGTPTVPEPGTLGLMLTGLLGAAGAVRRRFRA